MRDTIYNGLETGEEKTRWQAFALTLLNPNEEVRGIVIEPILNEKDCYHCHGASRKVIGGMVVRTNVEGILQTVTAARNRSLLVTILALGTILLISYALPRLAGFSAVR